MKIRNTDHIALHPTQYAHTGAQSKCVKQMNEIDSI